MSNIFLTENSTNIEKRWTICHTEYSNWNANIFGIENNAQQRRVRLHRNGFVRSEHWLQSNQALFIQLHSTNWLETWPHWNFCITNWSTSKCSARRNNSFNGKSKTVLMNNSGVGEKKKNHSTQDTFCACIKVGQFSKMRSIDFGQKCQMYHEIWMIESVTE